MKKLFQILGLVIVSFAILVGCGEEANVPTAATVAMGTITRFEDNFPGELGSTSSTAYYVYTPPEYDIDRAEGYPTMYMLHGFGGDENYFVGLFSAVDAADWLLSRDEIEPMILVFPSGHNALGGSFFTNSLHPAVGFSEAHILGIVTEVDAAFNTDTTAAGRGIGGHSMGSYGAFSIAMNNPGTFGSVAAIAGPLTFSGDALVGGSLYKGIEELIPAMLVETGYDAILLENPAGDSEAYKAMMYPSPERRLTSFLFAAGAAFSPSNPFAPGPTTIDSIIIGIDDNGFPIKQPMYVDLPISISGGIDTLTWNRWMVYDILERFLAGPDATLAGVNIFLDAGDMDDLGFGFSHQVFAGALALAGMTPSYAVVYTSTPDADGGDINADHTTHTFERIKKMLIWASGNF